MSYKIRRIPLFLRNALAVFREIQQQKIFNSKYLYPLLQGLEARHNGKFTPEQKQKIANYYGLYIAAFLGSAYKLLYGEKLNEAEREKAIFFAILTATGDDLTDIDKISAEELLSLTLDPYPFQPRSFLAKVARDLQIRMLEKVNNRQDYLDDARAVWQAQKNSEQQTRPLPDELLRAITFEKGAVSVIIYHHCLDQPMGNALRKALWHTGALYQWGNDLFDVYKDLRDGVFTLPLQCADFREMKKDFLQMVEKQNAAIRSLEASESAKRNFRIRINAINARSLVAIDHFISLNAPDVKNCDRRELITDMEKPANFMKWLSYCLEM